MNPDLITKLEQHLAALGSGRDAKSDNERADHWTATTLIRRTLSGLRSAPDDLAKATARLANVEAERVRWLDKQTELQQEIANAPDPATIRDVLERDKEVDRQRALMLSLQRLRDGMLLCAPGVTYGQLSTLDARIAELTERRNRAQRALDGCLQQAEALLSETVSIQGEGVHLIAR